MGGPAAVRNALTHHAGHTHSPRTVGGPALWAGVNFPRVSNLHLPISIWYSCNWNASDQWSNWWASVGQASVLIKLVLGKHGYNWASQVREASQVWGGKSLRNPHICAREVSLECYPCNLFLDICSHSTHELYFLDTWNWRPKNSLKWSNQPKIRQNYTVLEQKW